MILNDSVNIDSPYSWGVLGTSGEVKVSFFITDTAIAIAIEALCEIMPRVEPDALVAFTRAILSATGAPHTIADPVATSLVEADLRGHQSHGVRMLPAKYLTEIENGRIDPTAQPNIEFSDNALSIVDGEWAFGQIVGRTAVDTALEKARSNGIASVGIKRTSHIGRIGEWAERATSSGFAFLAYVCNPGNSWVAPAGSAHRRLSTNPIAMGLPTYDALEFPLILDFATSQVAYGKVRKRIAENQPFPADWVVDGNGDVITDPQRIAENDEWALLPLGGRTAGYKGFGLAVMSELLATHVTDSTSSGAEDVTWGNHALFVTIDLEQFTTPEHIRQRTSEFASFIRDTEFIAGLGPGDGAQGEDTLLPGEAEYRAVQRRRKRGIPVSKEDSDSLIVLADKLSLDKDTIPPALLNAKTE